MASGPQVSMESQRVHLIAQLLTAAISLLQDAVNPTTSPLDTTIKHARAKRHRTATDGNGKDPEEDHERSNGVSRHGVVVPIGPLLRSPVEASKEYALNFAAKYLNLSEQTIRKRITDGSLTAVKKGNGRGAWFITGEELIRFSNSSTSGDNQ